MSHDKLTDLSSIANEKPIHRTPLVDDAAEMEKLASSNVAEKLPPKEYKGFDIQSAKTVTELITDNKGQNKFNNYRTEIATVKGLSNDKERREKLLEIDSRIRQELELIAENINLNIADDSEFPLYGDLNLLREYIAGIMPPETKQQFSNEPDIEIWKKDPRQLPPDVRDFYLFAKSIEGKLNASSSTDANFLRAIAAYDQEYTKRKKIAQKYAIDHVQMLTVNSPQLLQRYQVESRYLAQLIESVGNLQSNLFDYWHNNLKNLHPSLELLNRINNTKIESLNLDAAKKLFSEISTALNSLESENLVSKYIPGSEYAKYVQAVKKASEEKKTEIQISLVKLILEPQLWYKKAKMISDDTADIDAMPEAALDDYYSKVNESYTQLSSILNALPEAHRMFFAEAIGIREKLQERLNKIKSMLEKLVQDKASFSAEAGSNKEREVYPTFWSYVDDIRVQLRNKDLGIVIENGKRREINFQNDSDEIISEFLEDFQTALFDFIQRKTASDVSSRGYPAFAVNIVGPNGDELFTFRTIETIRKNFNTLMDKLPTRLGPMKSLLKDRVTSYQMWLNRAQSFTDLLANPQGKTISTFLGIYDSQSKETGGMTYYDFNAMYQTKIDDNPIIPDEDKTALKRLVGEIDRTWNIGSIHNFFLARIRELVKDKKYNFAPWTMESERRRALETLLEEELASVFPSAKPLEVKVALEAAFWHFRSSGGEMEADKIARDTQFSRMLNSRIWLNSAFGKDLMRQEFFRPSLRKRFERMAVTQEQFAHVSVMLPLSGLQIYRYEDLPKDRQNQLQAEYSPAFKMEGNESVVDEVETAKKMNERLIVFKIKPENQIWNGGAEKFAGFVVLPKDQIYKDPRDGKTKDAVQIHMTLEQMRSSLVDLTHVDFMTMTASMNKRYANTMEFMRKWFENFGRYSHDHLSGEKAMFEKLHGFKDDHVERKAKLVPQIPEMLQKFGIEINKLQTYLSAPELVHENEHGEREYDYTKPRMRNIREAGLKMDQELRGLVHVPPFDSEDFKEFGVQKILHHTTDYLFNEMGIAGGYVYVKTDGGRVERRLVDHLNVMRKMFRSVHGDNIPELTDYAIQGYSTIAHFKDSMVIEEAREGDPKEKIDRVKKRDELFLNFQQRQKNNLVIAQLFLAIDIYLDQYAYEPSSFVPTVGSYAEIKTKSGQPPLDFMDRQKFIELMRYYIKDLMTDRTYAKAGFDIRIDEKQDDITPLLMARMVEKGIIGSPEQLVVDSRAFTSKKYVDLPNREERLKRRMMGEKKH